MKRLALEPELVVVVQTEASDCPTLTGGSPFAGETACVLQGPRPPAPQREETLFPAPPLIPRGRDSGPAPVPSPLLQERLSSSRPHPGGCVFASWTVFSSPVLSPVTDLLHWATFYLRCIVTPTRVLLGGTGFVTLVLAGETLVLCPLLPLG